MKNRLYQPYINDIEKALKMEHRHYNFTGNIDTDIVKGLLNESRELQPVTAMHDLASLLGITKINKPYKGDHPDFAHLRETNGVDYHYIVSMFIDVKGSTNFHKKYSLEQIAVIIQTIVSAATHTVALFGGHVQRLQYDGVFCYFGGRTISKNDAVAASIKAASFFSYFIKYELKDIFQIEGIDNVYTRVGIDFGDDNDVQWLIFGTPGCDELTTNSLHTSLAPKMQANARNNGIMIGSNVRDRLGTAQLFTDFLRDDKNNVDESQRYIFKNPDGNFYYSQYVFDWSAYLTETFWFISKDSSGFLFIDYIGSKEKSEKGQNSLDNLYQKTLAIESGTAAIGANAKINNHGNGVSIPGNRFYYE